MPNKLSQFWQELKHRNVVQVVTVYAGAAFVIIELINNITEPLHLPEWTPTLVIVLLAIGFPIVIIFSWIYDIHPEDGLVKTKPAHKVKEEDLPKSSNSWKTASYISFVVIVGLIVLNVIPRNRKETVSDILDKSIAVLPFINDSHEDENTYFINGVMEEILLNLQAIKDFQVPGRTSVEPYRNHSKSIPEIANELHVNYIIEGSAQKYGNTIRLRIQLLEGANGMHIWGDSYEKVIQNPEDLFKIQSEIAQSIAAELQAVLTPEEKELIEKVPTTSLTALDYYQQARDNHWEYWMHGDTEALQRSKNLYHKALENDPAFAKAYNGLAGVYFAEHGSEEYLKEGFLDSVLILTDISLSLDPKISETHVIRGLYYSARNNPGQAIIELDKAQQLNPNEWMVYFGKATLYASGGDYLLAIENRHQAVNLNRGQGLAGLLFNLSQAYNVIGFDNQGKIYAQQYLDLTGDSSRYYFLISYGVPFYSEERIEIFQKAYRLDSSFEEVIYQIGEIYSFLGNHKESLKYFERWLNLGRISTNRYHRIGYAYWHTGDKEKAEYYFDKQLEYSLGEINLGRRQAGSYFTYYDLAGTYAFRGEKRKAYEYLRMFNQKEKMPIYIVEIIKVDPLFDSIRDEPEFQQIVRDVEAKYQAEHERVRQWLEENDMI